MADEYTGDFININLDDVDTMDEAIPEGPRVCSVSGLAVKKKDGGEYPYIEVLLHPEDETFKKRRLRLTLSFHPNALWNLIRFYKAFGVSLKGVDLKDFVQKNIYREIDGKSIGVNVGIEPDRNDPEVMRNVVKPPYFKA